MIGMAQGLVTTFKHLLRPAITLRYPDVKTVLPERSRTSFVLPLSEDGAPLCKSCGVCAKNCPDNAIVIESEKNPDGPGRVLTKFTIDLGTCMYCGICVENCPSMGLAHTGDYETATHLKDETILVLFDSTVAHESGAEQAEQPEPAMEPSPVPAPATETVLAPEVSTSSGASAMSEAVATPSGLAEEGAL